MLKYSPPGMALGAAVALVLGLNQLLAGAQERVRVQTQCPAATWTGSYSFFERIPVPPDEYKPARVNNKIADVRTGAGFDSGVAFELSTGEEVTIRGEAWDMGCNQWMQVETPTEEGLYWMHGNTLQLLAVGDPPPDSGGDNEVPNPFNTPVASLCPDAAWASDYSVGELIPLKPEQYKSAVVIGDETTVRDRASFESKTVLTLDSNAPVTIVGEAWDSGCNQWMQVQINSERHWMHGNTLRLGS